MTHVGDEAELYALGALDDAERALLEAHVATCEPCARRLGEAEAAVTAMMVAELPPGAFEYPRSRTMPRTSRALQWLVAAAVVCILALPAAYFAHENARMHAAMSANETLAARIASGDLQSAGFKMMHGAPMHARVLYDRAGDWYCVIVDRPQAPMQVAYVHPDGSVETIGSVAMRAGASMTVMPIAHKMNELVLMDGPTVVAEARLAF